MPLSNASLKENQRAPFWKSGGLGPNVSEAGIVDNGYVRRAYTADGTGTIDIWGTDAENNLMVGGGAAVTPTWLQVRFKAMTNGAVVTTNFHVFNVSGRIKRITQIHSTQASAGTVTAVITKEIDGQAPGAGTSLQASGTSFNLRGTNETLQTATLNTTDRNADGSPILEFSAGEAISFKLTGTPTSAAGVYVAVYVQYDLPVFEQSWYSAAATSQDQCFFIANRLYPVRAIRFRHATAETTDTTANVQVTQDTSTNAPGAGTDLLTNDSSAGFDINAVANTVQLGVLAAATELVAGDRLGLDFNSTQTEGAGICVTACFNQEEAGRIETTYWLYDTDVLDAYFMFAERSYEMYDGRFLHAVAAGGASTANLEKLRSTTAVGGGTAMLASTIDFNATANTIQIVSLSATTANRQLAGGDRACIDFASAEQSLVGVCFTISWRTR